MAFAAHDVTARAVDRVDDSESEADSTDESEAALPAPPAPPAPVAPVANRTDALELLSHDSTDESDDDSCPPPPPAAPSGGDAVLTRATGGEPVLLDRAEKAQFAAPHDERAPVRKDPAPLSSAFEARFASGEERLSQLRARHEREHEFWSEYLLEAETEDDRSTVEAPSRSPLPPPPPVHPSPPPPSQRTAKRGVRPPHHPTLSPSVVGRFKDRGFSHNPRYVQKKHESSITIQRRRAAEKIAQENQRILRRLETVKSAVRSPSSPTLFATKPSPSAVAGAQPPMRFK